MKREDSSEDAVEEKMKKEGGRGRHGWTNTSSTQSTGVLHKYGANNKNAGGFILNTAANN